MTIENIIIRPFDVARDTAALVGIWFEASIGAHAFIGRDRLLEQKELIEHKYLPMAETWMACRGEQPVGFISLLGAFVGGIFVSPKCQGQGIGRRLIAFALEQMGELSLDVYSANEKAFRFYLSLGFEEVSRRPFDDEGLPFELTHLRLTSAGFRRSVGKR